MRARNVAPAVLLALMATKVDAQSTATVAPGPEYDAGPVWQWLFGSNWRDLWLLPVKVDVLDLGHFAGGLEPVRAGGNQSKTLHFKGRDGTPYVFRSMNKFIDRALPEDLQHTWTSALIQDHTSAMHPTGTLTLHPIQKRMDVLHAVPKLVIMPDDPRLGEFRETYAGMIGVIEVKPEEGPDDTPGFAGSSKVTGSDKLLERLDESSRNKIAAREYLAARLIDFITSDTDRGADQWDWARFEQHGFDVWRPIQRDKDYAYMVANGVLSRVAAYVFPKLVVFNKGYPKFNALTFMTREFDRSHLIELEWSAWDSVVTRLEQTLTDDVIEQALNRLPPEHRERSEIIAVALRAKRNTIRGQARKYFDMVSRDADVFASAEDETAEVTRYPDGSVLVELYRTEDLVADGNGGTVPFFRRHFIPEETREIRIYLEQGDDRAVVRGDVDHSIKVRITGGDGDDILVDSSRVAGGTFTAFYDAVGNNQFVTTAATKVDRGKYRVPQPRASYDDDEEEEPEEADGRIAKEERRGRFQDLLNDEAGKDFIDQKTSPSVLPRTWGEKSGFRPAADYREGAGVIVGAGWQNTTYGFRRAPYKRDLIVNGFYAINSGGFGVVANYDRRLENSGFGWSVNARATQFESLRFYGYGNNTENISASRTLVMRDEVQLHPRMFWSPGPRTSIGVGPIAKYVNPNPEEFGPFEQQRPLGSSKFGQAGVRADGQYDGRNRGVIGQHGWSLYAGGSFYPAVWDAPEPFGEVHAEGAVHIPVGWPTLALRAGGKRVWGEFPVHEAAFIGGRTTVRGFRWDRFAGDASAYGSAELRAPLGRIELLTRGQLGVLGFVDTGRVWFNGDSPGGWHTGVGGGLYFSSLGQAVSVMYAKGETGRVYLQWGLPF